MINCIYRTLLFLLLYSLVGITLNGQNLSGLSNTATNIQQDVSSEIAKTYALMDKIKKENRYVDILDMNMAFPIPLALSKNIGGIEYTVIIDSLLFSANGYGKLNARMLLDIPGYEEKLVFRGTDIAFHQGGLTGSAKLILLTDVGVQVGSGNVLRFRNSGNTFVSFNCDGFESLSIDGELEFSRDLLVPENSDGTVPANGNVKASFATVVKQWGELMMRINIPNFQLAPLPGFGFTVNEAYLDYSDIANPPSIVFPKNYSSPLMPDNNSPLWQGVFLKALEIRMPSQFENGTSSRTSISATNAIIDDMGFSGNIKGLNLIGLDKGKIANWAFSLDSVGIDLTANQINSAGLRGKLQVPVVDPNTPFKYNAIVSTGSNYLFQISNTGNLGMSMWAAKLDIYPNSSLEIKVANGRFLPKAVLNGKISITKGGDGGGVGVSMPSLAFQELQIQTVSPLVSVKSFDFTGSGQSKASNFPITIKDVTYKSLGNDVGVGFTLAVNFVGEKDGGFAADAGLTVWGQMKQGSIASYQFKEIELNSMSVNIDGGAFKMAGSLIVYKQDPVYGQGFKGTIAAWFKPGLSVSVTAQFGNVNEMRYWYCDGLASFKPGIQIFTGVALYAFGGGAYYKMKQVVTSPVKLPDNSTLNKSDGTTDAGKSLSGISYVPDSRTSLGIMASIIIGTSPTPEAFNGTAKFGISFNSGGGIKKVSIEGSACFMCEIGKDPATAPAAAKIYLGYDVDKSELMGTLTTYIDFKVVQGAGPGNKAGDALVYFSPNEWYIYIGRPEHDKRIGIKLLGLFTMKAYLVMGTNIPGMPPPLAQVTKIINAGVQERDDLAMRRGGGFGFGASMEFSTGDLTFLIFYANFSMGAGFDVMLKNYGSDTKCDGSSDAIGLNGWYAQGQAYAYLTGSVGIKIDLPFHSGKFTIFSGGAAALLQAKLPNPTWLKGNLAGYYEVLGGLVKGKFSFEMEIGKKCVISNANPLAGIKVIGECSPANNATDVDVFSAPQATFNLEIDKNFQLNDANNNPHTYRVVLDYVKVKDGSSEIEGTYEWNSGKDVVAFNSRDILTPLKSLSLSVKVHFEEFKNGKWEKLYYNGKESAETYEGSFTTGKAPDYIPKNNIAYAYPVLNQFNFYTKEYTGGYIKLLKGQPYLFKPGSEWKQVARFEGGGQTKEAPIFYDEGSLTVGYTMPELPVNSPIKYTMVNVPVVANAAIDKNLSTTTSTAFASADNTADKKNTEVEGTLKLLQEKNIFDTYFRTSTYKTFTEKLNVIQMSPAWNWSVYDGIDQIGVNLKSPELFDKFELSDGINTKKLVDLEATTENPWLKNGVIPLVYDNYPVMPGMELARTTSILGVPPLRAIYFNQEPVSREFTDADKTGAFGNLNIEFAELVYDLVWAGYLDYFDLQGKAAYYSTRSYNSFIGNILKTPYPNIFRGNYKVKIKYTLPGINTVTTEKELPMKF